MPFFDFLQGHPEQSKVAQTTAEDAAATVFTKRSQDKRRHTKSLQNIWAVYSQHAIGETAKPHVIGNAYLGSGHQEQIWIDTGGGNDLRDYPRNEENAKNLRQFLRTQFRIELPPSDPGTVSEEIAFLRALGIMVIADHESRR